MMKKLGIKVFFFLSMFTINFSLFTATYAAHPLITDDSSTQATGKYQVEINGKHANDNGDTATEMAASSTVQRKISTSTSA